MPLPRLTCPVANTKDTDQSAFKEQLDQILTVCQQVCHMHMSCFEDDCQSVIEKDLQYLPNVIRLMPLWIAVETTCFAVSE